MPIAKFDKQQLNPRLRNLDVVNRASGPTGLIVHVIDLTGGRRASIYWHAPVTGEATNTLIEYKGVNAKKRREETVFFATIGQAVDYAALW